MLNKKLATIPVFLIFVSAIVGLAYAHWTKTFTITGNVTTTELDWRLQSPSCLDGDNENDYTCDDSWSYIQGDKDVGGPTLLELVDSDGDGDEDTLNVTLQNVYPGYYERITFDVYNNGKMPLIFKKVIINGQEFTSDHPTVSLDLNNDGKDDIKIKFADNLGEQLDPDDSFSETIHILILQSCIEGQTLTFTIQLVAENWSPQQA